MALQEYLDYLDEAVGEELKPISYKWLARHFNVPSNYAKQILFKYAELRNNSVRVVYMLSGWLKTDNTSHVIQLVDSTQLSGARNLLEPVTGMHVHSILPGRSQKTQTDAIWSHEHQQATELLKKLLSGASGAAEECLQKNTTSAIKFDVGIQPYNQLPPRVAPVAPEGPASGPTSGPRSGPASGPSKPSSGAAATKVPGEQPKPPAAGKPSAVSGPAAIGQAGLAALASVAAPRPQDKPAAVSAPAKPSSPAKRKNSGGLASLWGKASTKPQQPSSGNAAPPAAKPAAASAPAAGGAAAVSKSELQASGSAAPAVPKPAAAPAAGAAGAAAVSKPEPQASGASSESLPVGMRRVVAQRGKRRLLEDDDDDEQQVQDEQGGAVESLKAATPPAKAPPATKQARTADTDEEIMDAIAEVPMQQLTEPAAALAAALLGKHGLEDAQPEGLPPKKPRGEDGDDAVLEALDLAGMGDDDGVDDAEAMEVEAPPHPPAVTAAPAAPAAAAMVKVGAAVGGRQRVARTYINAKGEEVMEMVVEEGAAEQQQQQQQPAALATKDANGGLGKGIAAAAPASGKGGNGKDASGKGSGAAKGSGKAAKVAPQGQKNIMNFFKKP